MDREHFDTLARLVSTQQSRRSAVVALLGATLLGHEIDAALAKRLRRGRQASHRPGKDKENRKGKRKGKHKGKPKGAPQYFDCGTEESPRNDGKPCGESAHGGTTLRCCQGDCPDPFCHPAGYTGIACSTTTDCFDAGLYCCGDYTECDDEEGQCLCADAEPGTGCGTDADCAFFGRVCVCGTCV